MPRIIYIFTLVLLTISINTLTAGNILPAVLTYDMNACLSEAGNGTNSDYSELTATPANNGAVRLSPYEGGIYRQNPITNPHSCTPGLNGTNAICIAVNPFCDYIPGSPEALRFDILVEPLIGEAIRIEELNFQQKAPEMFNWVNGNTALNNYPTLYGIRILANNQVIYEEHDIPTTRDWNLETTNFHGNSNFLVAAPTVFSFELLPYCAAGVVGFYSIWDIEDINLSAACVNDCSEVVNGGEVFLMDGTYTYYACEGSAEFQVQNNSTLNPQDFDYLITDSEFNIIRVSESSADLNLSDYLAGTYFVFGFSGDGSSLIGSNISQITNAGCIELSSNSITVLVNKPGGGVITGGPFEFCQNDQNSNFIPADAITLSGEIGTNSRWIITDETGSVVLFVPSHPSEVDFSTFEAGTCLIYHVTFDGWLKGLEAGGLLSELESGSDISSTCYDLSNPITVIKRNINTPTLTGGPFSFCIGDGVADKLSDSDIELMAGSGQVSMWVATAENGSTILAVEDNISDLDFDTSGIGTCLVWNLSYDEIIGLQVGEDINSISGCYAQSTPIIVNRFNSEGGILTGGPFEFCVGDGQADLIPMGEVMLNGNLGSNGQWIVSDQNGIITALPNSFEEQNFENTSMGVCYLSHLSYSGNLVGLVIGGSVNEIEGCYKLSNQVSVLKKDCTPIEGGTISGGPFAFCTGDGIRDRLTNISRNGVSGSFNQWILTSETGMITELISTLDQKNFEGSSSGVCLLWNVSYETGLVGLDIGNNVNMDLIGQYGLSNSIMITKSLTTAGVIIGGPFSFCVGDGEEDRIPQGDITLMGNAGLQGTWIATDETSSQILSVADQPNDFDFDNAGSGNCIIYHLSYDGNINGLVAESPVAAIDGCYSLSNGIFVNRTYVYGGELQGGPGYFEFCVGDGELDNIPLGALNLVGNIGETQTWVITNTSGTEILDVPNSPYNVDFDNTLPGTCVLWSISSTGPVEGLEVGGNFLSLQGCLSKSTFISIFRYQNTGGMLTGGPFDFCVGNNIPDVIADGSIVLSGNTGANGQWIITDANGIITNLPVENYDEIDFDLMEAGTSLIYHLSYDGPIGGLVGGLPLGGLTGCYTLSNSLSITKNLCPQPISGLIINEVNTNGVIEIKNTSETKVKLDDYWLCSSRVFEELNNLDIVCGDNYELAAGENIFLKSDFSISEISGEIALMYDDKITEKKKMNHYVVWGSPTSNMTEQAITEGIWSADDMISSLPEGTVLVYDGEGFHSSDWTIEESSSCNISSSDDLFYNHQVKVYPNPVIGKLNIELGSSINETHVEILSKLGKVLLSTTVSGKNQVLDLQELDAGMYFLRIKQMNSSTIQAVIKI